jgi:Arm domain-containing DNA-binding protein
LFKPDFLSIWIDERNDKIPGISHWFATTFLDTRRTTPDKGRTPSAHLVADTVRTQNPTDNPTAFMRLTDKTIKALQTPERGNKITYDEEPKGFGVRVTAAGARAFVLNYRRKADGVERRYTIGAFPDWSAIAFCTITCRASAPAHSGIIVSRSPSISSRRLAA